MRRGILQLRYSHEFQFIPFICGGWRSFLPPAGGGVDFEASLEDNVCASIGGHPAGQSAFRCAHL